MPASACRTVDGGVANITDDGGVGPRRASARKVSNLPNGVGVAISALKSFDTNDEDTMGAVPSRILAIGKSGIGFPTQQQAMATPTVRARCVVLGIPRVVASAAVRDHARSGPLAHLDHFY